MLNEFVGYGTDYKEDDFFVDEDTIQTDALVRFEKDSDWDEFSEPTKEDEELWKKGKKKLYNAHFIFTYDVYKKEKLEFSKGGSMASGGDVKWWTVKLKMPNGETAYEDVIAEDKDDAEYYGELTDSAVEGGKVLSVKFKGIETYAKGGSMARGGEVEGTYGGSKTETTIYTYEERGGTWYVADGSVNVNFTYDEVEDGVDIEELNDADMFTASSPIESVNDLENAVDSDDEEDYAKGGSMASGGKQKITHTELRSMLKDIGHKVSFKRNSLGVFAIVKNKEGEELPTIFFGEEHREKWLPIIELKNKYSISKDNEKVFFAKGGSMASGGKLPNSAETIHHWFNKLPYDDQQWIVWESHQNKFDDYADQDALYKYMDKHHKNSLTVEIVEKNFTYKQGFDDFGEWLDDNYSWEHLQPKLFAKGGSMASGGEITSYGLSFSKVDYDVNVNPQNLEVDVNIKESDSVDYYGLNDTDAEWSQHTWGYMVYPKSVDQLYDVLKALKCRVSKKRLEEWHKKGGSTYAEGGEIPSEREIVEYYGQNYDNVKHIRGYVDSLVQRYKEEHFGGGSMASGGEVNGKYLDSISADKKSKILNNIAKHYGISVSDAEGEVKDADAENLFEYIANDDSLRMSIYNDFKREKYYDGGGVKELSNDFKEVSYNIWARDFGVAQIGGFNDGKDINILVTAELIDMLSATGDSQFDDKPFVWNISTHAYPEFWSA